MIEVGEYVRIKKGKIDKVTNDNCYMPQYIECKKSLLYKEDIIKHSKNIIDLIEVGDIVNKSEVLEKGMQRDGKKWIYTYQGKLYYETELEKLTILTKEQYKANCYTVERRPKE